jgi:hypothetical protein
VLNPICKLARFTSTILILPRAPANRTRVYKFLAGHKDWEKEEGHNHKHKKFLTVLRHKKVINHDGTSSYVQEPTRINAKDRHQHDNVVADEDDDDNMTFVESRSSSHQMRQQANTQSV